MKSGIIKKESTKNNFLFLHNSNIDFFSFLNLIKINVT